MKKLAFVISIVAWSHLAYADAHRELCNLELKTRYNNKTLDYKEGVDQKPLNNPGKVFNSFVGGMKTKEGQKKAADRKRTEKLKKLQDTRVCVESSKKHLTKAEAQAALNFYKTSAGKRYPEKRALVEMDLNRHGQ